MTTERKSRRRRRGTIDPQRSDLSYVLDEQQLSSEMQRFQHDWATAEADGVFYRRRNANEREQSAIDSRRRSR